MATVRIAVLIALHTALLSAALPPRDWVPLRWDGGPLELARRRNQPPVEQENGQRTEFRPLSETETQAIRDWYRSGTLDLLDGTPYNCLLLTWSLGEATGFDAEQWKLVTGYARQAREKGLVTLGVVAFGPDWQSAVEAAAAVLDGVVLDGEFPEGAADWALDALKASHPDAVVIPMGSWKNVNWSTRLPIIGSREGNWPGLLTASEAEGWRAGPTSNPWLVSNGWQIGVLRADGSGRPIWMGHRPTRHQPQPLELKDYMRAVADSGMAGARLVVALCDDWRPGLYGGDKEAIKQWRELAEHVRFFEAQKEWKSFKVWPSVVVVHDPKHPSSFDTFDILNMLAVRHVPHRVVLRSDFSPDVVPAETKVVAYDFAPPDEPEHRALQSFTSGGGTLMTGPRWSKAQHREDSEFKRVIAGAGSIRGYPAEEVDSGRFSREVRSVVDGKHGAPKLYNVGSIISHYSVDPDSGRALLQMTEYGDYPSENITVRFPRIVKKARMHVPGEPPADLEIYPGEEGGSEIDVPRVPSYCAVVIDVQPPQEQE